jgi:hypothetical protein
MASAQPSDKLLCMNIHHGIHVFQIEVERNRRRVFFCGSRSKHMHPLHCHFHTMDNVLGLLGILELGPHGLIEIPI